MIATASFGMVRRPAIVDRAGDVRAELAMRPTFVRVSRSRTGSIGTKVVAVGGGGGAVPMLNVRVLDVAMTLPAASSALTRQQ